MKFETRFCTSADGTRIAYAVRDGTAPPLLTVHGWASLISDWNAVTSDSSPERTRVLYDRRGAGASTRDVDDISLERQVEDVSAIAADLRADTIDVYAFWDGTPIAIAFAAEHPERVGRMALMGPYLRGSDVISRDALRATMDLAHTQLADVTPVDPHHGSHHAWWGIRVRSRARHGESAPRNLA